MCETNTSAAQNAYGAILAHNTRNDMLRAAALAYFSKNKEGLAQANNIFNRVRNFAARRNEIAHGMVVQLHDNGTDSGHFLVPPMYNFNKRGTADRTLGKYQYTSAQVNQFATEFQTLANEVRVFFQTVTKPKS